MLRAVTSGLIVVFSLVSATSWAQIQQPHSVRSKAAREVASMQATPGETSTLDLLRNGEAAKPTGGSAISPQPPRTEAGREHQPANNRLMARVRRVLDSYYLQPMNTKEDSPWSLLHWSIAYGVDATVCMNSPNGQQVTAIGWLCSNYPANGVSLITPTKDGIYLPVAPGRQGHDGQFLSMLAQSRVNQNYILRVGDKSLAVADLVDYEKRTCRSGMELTFKLIGLAYYESATAEWKNARGEPWSIGQLLQEELEQPISRREATCGGTHRLFAINYAVERRQLEGLPISGVWLVAKKRTEAYQRRAFQLQNPDGSFSTNWFDGPEHRNDVTRRLTTSGHILEYLAYSLPEQQLRDPRLERAVAYVASLLEGKQQSQWHRGALGHALHALSIYEQRILGVEPGERSERLAAGQEKLNSSQG
jgi:hypothetical protein